MFRMTDVFQFNNNKVGTIWCLARQFVYEILDITGKLPRKLNYAGTTTEK